jgi:hypothetical protein
MKPIFLIMEIIANKLHREGKIVKALDASGEPLLRNGQQVWQLMDRATDTEFAFWCKENNKVN